MLRRQRTAASGPRSALRPRRSSCGQRACQSERRRCSTKDRAANTRLARGRGGAQRRTAENRSAHSAAGYPWGQRCLSENACGPLLHRTRKCPVAQIGQSLIIMPRRSGCRNVGICRECTVGFPAELSRLTPYYARLRQSEYVGCLPAYWRCHIYARATTIIPNTMRYTMKTRRLLDWRYRMSHAMVA